MHFGFSYVGLIYLVMLFVPNLFWTKHKPKDYDNYVKNENKVLRIVENIGQVLVTCIVLIFKDFNVKFDSIWTIWLLLSFVLMVLYELNWLRYFKSEKTVKIFTEVCLVFLWQVQHFLLSRFYCLAFTVRIYC